MREKAPRGAQRVTRASDQLRVSHCFSCRNSLELGHVVYCLHGRKKKEVVYTVDKSCFGAFVSRNLNCVGKHSIVVDPTLVTDTSSFFFFSCHRDTYS